MFGAEIEVEIRAHAAREFPKESCGLIVAGRYIACANLSPNPEVDFRIDPAAYLASTEQGLQAVIHSHPEGHAYPSRADMEQQIATDVPWGICANGQVFWFGDGVPTPPLVGRGFRHGVTDCYSLIRDWYKLERQITLKEFPRSWEWWSEANGGDQFYDRRFTEAGFREVDRPKIGDVITMVLSAHAECAAHAGIYLGGDNWINHRAAREGYDPQRLSVIEPIGRHVRLIKRVLRYHG